MNWKNIMLSDRNLSQKATYCMILWIWNVQNSQVYRDRKISDCQMLKKGGNRQLPLVIWGFFWSDKNILKLDNDGSYTKINIRWYIYKYVMTCKSYLSETVKKAWGRSAHIGPRKELASHQNMLTYLQCYPLTTVYSTGMTYLTVKVTLDVFISQHSLEHSEF